MSGKAKTAQKGSSSGKGPNDHGFKHEPANVTLVLEFRRGPNGVLRPKKRFVKGA